MENRIRIKDIHDLKDNTYSILPTSNGLYEGKMGIAISYLTLAKGYDNKIFKEKGNKILHDVIENISYTEDLSFKEGVLGVGWGLEWLKQSKILDINTDFVLEEVDDTIYKLVVFALDKGLSLQDGLLGKLAYYFKRLKGRSLSTHRYRYLCHQECIVILTDNLYELLYGEEGLLNIDETEILKQIDQKDIVELTQVLLLISKFVNVNDPAIKKMFTKTMLFADYYMNILIKKGGCYRDRNPSFSNTISFFALSFYTAAKESKDTFWEEKGIQHVNDIISQEKKLRHNNKELIESLKINTLLHYYFPENGYEKKAKNDIKRINVDMASNIFYNGIYSIYLCQMCLYRPEYNESCAELLFIN